MFGVPVLDGIGSTEMLHMFMSNHEGEVRYGSSGRLLKGYAARLLTSKAGQALPVPVTFGYRVIAQHSVTGRNLRQQSVRL